ncbi:hypothetical protein VTO73DRAFT_8883 [Trametes versicolor]
MRGNTLARARYLEHCIPSPSYLHASIISCAHDIKCSKRTMCGGGTKLDFAKTRSLVQCSGPKPYVMG